MIPSISHLNFSSCHQDPTQRSDTSTDGGKINGEMINEDLMITRTPYWNRYIL